MNIAFSCPEMIFNNEIETCAAQILKNEFSERINIDYSKKSDYFFRFITANDILSSDEYRISVGEDEMIINACALRGFIFAIGLILRKIEKTENKIKLADDISGFYSPEKNIRGHQIGYRPCSNTYDAWDIEKYRRYYLDIMYFGANTCEHIPYEKGVSCRNELMRFDEQELLYDAIKEAKKLDLQVSLWYPNSEKTIEEALKNREEVFAKCEKLEYLFPPGGDPGHLQPEQLFSRLKSYKKLLDQYHPNAQIWPSAQKPRQFPTWEKDFALIMKEEPEYISGIITGPNAAFKIDALRRWLPKNYPIRFYPDITHNLRCEHPVHFDKDDWNYALAATNGRESTNPRPCEYKKLHEIISRYCIGSVSYSEGVNDDVNKAVWCALDYNSSLSIREILEDYARLFFFGSNPEKTADAVLGLELNWVGAPENNPGIEHTLALWEELLIENPKLKTNWRYLQHLFRAKTDTYVRRKVLFEKSLIEKAKKYAVRGEIEKAQKILSTPLPDSITSLYETAQQDADDLFNIIGMQLSTEKHKAENFERGAVLDTINLPVTDLPWLLSRFNKLETKPKDKHTEYIKKCFDKNKVDNDEYYYSVALNGICPGGVTQSADFYMDVLCDRPNINNGTLPTSLFKLFDHYDFVLKTGGLKYDTDYYLSITVKDNGNTESDSFVITVNNNIVYCGEAFGKNRNTNYENDFLPDGFINAWYKIPKEFIVNGCVDICIKEPKKGFELAELMLTKNIYHL